MENMFPVYHVTGGEGHHVAFYSRKKFKTGDYMDEESIVTVSGETPEAATPVTCGTCGKPTMQITFEP